MVLSRGLPWRRFSQQAERGMAVAETRVISATGNLNHSVFHIASLFQNKHNLFQSLYGKGMGVLKSTQGLTRNNSQFQWRREFLSNIWES